MFLTEFVNLECEPITIDYTRKHRYTPDFLIPGTNIFVELKGAFEKDEPGKYEAITEQGGFAFLFFSSVVVQKLRGKNLAKMVRAFYTKNGSSITTKKAFLSTALLKTSLLALKRAKRSQRSSSVTK